MDIKNFYDAIIFTSAALTLKEALIEAVSNGANLRGADLRSADLRGAKNAELAIARMQFIPTEGAFIGWKKCCDGKIVKLRIPADAKRSHGAERKCGRQRVQDGAKPAQILIHLHQRQDGKARRIR